jgi:hypothetical protein
MALPSEADIPRILDRIRPAASWGWKGGAASDPANLEWRDQVQPEPTLTELEDEWTAIAAELATAETVRQQLKNEYTPLVGLSLGSLTNAQSRTLLEILVYIMGGIDEETRVLKPANQWQAAKEILKA